MPERSLFPVGINATVTKINRYLSTPGYILLVMLLTLLSNILGIEPVVYTVFILLFAYICLFGEDLLLLCSLRPQQPGTQRSIGFLFPKRGHLFSVFGRYSSRDTDLPDHPGSASLFRSKIQASSRYADFDRCLSAGRNRQQRLR